jgi:hypothetical protein
MIVVQVDHVFALLFSSNHAILLFFPPADASQIANGYGSPAGHYPAQS